MRVLFVLMSLLLLGACGSSRTGVEPVVVAPGVTLTLPRPGDLGRKVEVVQMVAARHGGEIVMFDGRLSVEPGRVLLVCSDAMGRRAMTVTWTDGALEVERAAWLPESLRPENILADIVLLYWPKAIVQSALRGAELTEDATGRKLGDVIAVSWQGDPLSGTANLRNIAWDYELDVQSIVVGP